MLIFGQKAFFLGPTILLGNASEWVQWVHAPENLQDITVCTHRILTDFITVLVFQSRKVFFVKCFLEKKNSALCTISPFQNFYHHNRALKSRSFQLIETSLVNKNVFIYEKALITCPLSYCIYFFCTAKHDILCGYPLENAIKTPFLSDSSQLLNSNSFPFNSSSLEYKADIFL